MYCNLNYDHMILCDQCFYLFIVVFFFFFFFLCLISSLNQNLNSVLHRASTVFFFFFFFLVSFAFPVITIQREPVSAVSSDINFPMKGRRGMKDWARTAEDKLYIPKEVFTNPTEGKRSKAVAHCQGFLLLVYTTQPVSHRMYCAQEHRFLLHFFPPNNYQLDLQALDQSPQTEALTKSVP